MDNIAARKLRPLVYNLGSTYEAALTANWRLRLGTSVRYCSNMFNQPQETYLSPALTLWDLTAGLQTTSNRWGIDLTVKNLTNAISQDFASPSVDPRFGAFYGP